MNSQEHKKPLHDRIIERKSKLEQSLVRLKSDPKTAASEHTRAVEDALGALETHVAGGWENIGNPEAAALARWLEWTRFLYDESATAPVSEPAKSPARAVTPPPEKSV
jgi:hypothetical protein